MLSGKGWRRERGKREEEVALKSRERVSQSVVVVQGRGPRSTLNVVMWL